MRWTWSLIAVLGWGCADLSVAPREAEVASVLARADEVLIRARPALCAGKYARMALTPYEFYRGSLPLFRHDWELGRTGRSGFVNGEPPVWGLGDPHPENFGVLVDADGVGALEPNDFDAADRVPYLFDLRRLVAGLGVAVRVSGAEVSVSKLGAAAAGSYARRLIALSQGEAPQRVVGPGHGPVQADVFRRSSRDLGARAELGGLTVVDSGLRRFRRGVLDEAEPTGVLASVPAEVLPELLSVLATLREGPVRDVVREYGTGVASWPRVRVLALLDGPTESLDDDVVVEVKELTESALAGWYRPVLPAVDASERVVSGARRAWFRPDADPRFFASHWLGLPVVVRTESEAHKGIRVERLVDARASEAALLSLADDLGALLARVHSRSEATTVAAIAAQLGRDVDGFANEQGAFAEVYSADAVRDAAHFGNALQRLGATLGISADVREAPTGLAAAVFGEGT